MDKTNNKQKLLLEYLVSSPDTFALCKGIVKPTYFDPEYRKAVEFLHEYYDKYNATPTTSQISAETSILLTTQPITRDQIKYCSDEIEAFCRRKALQHAIVSASGLIADENYAKIEQSVRDAIAVSLNRDLGVSYFEGRRERLEAMTKVQQRTSTGWPAMDELMAGGLARTEMILFSANSGGGKSITLANLAVNMLSQKLNVLYITLELSEELIEQRFDTMYTGVSSVIWKQNYREIADTVEDLAPHMGKLDIKRMPTGTCANDIRAYLKEFELQNGFVPDLLIVDYLDIMGPNERVSVDNVFEKDKRSAEQLRDIGFEYNMFIATASQQNRSAVDAQELNHSHIAGGISKINTVDWYFSIIMNTVMKAAGDIGFNMLKSRSSDGVGKTIYLTWDNNSLRIRSRKGKIDDGVIEFNKPPDTNHRSGKKSKSLMDIIG
jgi:RecA/RadA recombinase